MSIIDLALRDAQTWFEDLPGQGGPELRQPDGRKLVKEAAEFAEAPSLEEAADVAIVLLGHVLGLGYSIDDLGREIRRKTCVNRRRTWVEQPDGTWQHREEAPDGP